MNEVNEIIVSDILNRQPSLMKIILQIIRLEILVIFTNKYVYMTNEEI